MLWRKEERWMLAWSLVISLTSTAALAPTLIGSAAPKKRLQAQALCRDRAVKIMTSSRTLSGEMAR
eukprot:4180513-Amphidinium_carterae.1